jgi:hypothetical protein
MASKDFHYTTMNKDEIIDSIEKHLNSSSFFIPSALEESNISAIIAEAIKN